MRLSILALSFLWSIACEVAPMPGVGPGSRTPLFSTLRKAPEKYCTLCDSTRVQSHSTRAGGHSDAPESTMAQIPQAREDAASESLGLASLPPKADAASQPTQRLHDSATESARSTSRMPRAARPAASRDRSGEELARAAEETARLAAAGLQRAVEAVAATAAMEQDGGNDGQPPVQYPNALAAMQGGAPPAGGC